jgi:hypothetical protein
MTLMLHSGAEEVSFDALRAVETPEATRSHVPIPHHSVVDMVKYALTYFGHDIVSEHHGLTPDGNRYFGTLSLRSRYGDYEDTVGLRNSHDKRFPIGISMGAHVFVCDNLSFSGDQVIKRKHTLNAKRDLPGLVAEIVEPLAQARALQQRTFELYRNTPISINQVDHAIMQMYRTGVINVQRIAEVEKEWETPSFVGFEDRTAWRLFNAATFALNGKVLGNPQATQKLHSVIDGVCEVVKCQENNAGALVVANR